MIHSMRVCLLTLLVLSASAADVTFTRDVYPILRANCAGCHQKGEIGPMPLTTYAEARPWAAAIRQAVACRRRNQPSHCQRPGAE